MLVVDDLPEIGDFFRSLVRRVRGGDVDLVVEINSARALDLVRTTKYDLIVSDFRMRELDGIEVLAAAHRSDPDGVRVLMTGYNEIPTTMARIRQANIDAYIQKPLKAQDLRVLLSQLLARDPAALAACRAAARELEVLGSTEGSAEA